MWLRALETSILTGSCVFVCMQKVASRANRIETRTFEELKEYSDSSTQYEPEMFMTAGAAQTDPEPIILRASFSIQTEEPAVASFAIQTDPDPLPPPRITVEMEIQTDDPEPEPVEEVSRSPSPQNDDSMASSSSTIVPPTPKPLPPQPLEPADQPPAYNQINPQELEERDWRVAAETVKKWHHGVHIPFEPVAGEVSQEAVEEWTALKAELGVGCMVIDKIVDASERTPRRESIKNPPRGSRNRFYNIYNTYVYGDKDKSGGLYLPTGLAGQAVLWVGASALVLLAVSPYMAPQYSVPGGATYYDRQAWNSFNSMQAAGEGFSPDGTAAVWNFLGRVGGGAARIARGWPT